jgi:HAMP domain-containing protein
VSGEREVERSLETIEDGLEDAQDAAERLDDEDPNVEVDADVADEQQKLQAALNTVRALNSKDANIDVDADGVQETIAEGVAAAQRLDDLEADIDLDVDRDGLRRAVSGLPSSGDGGRRDRVRLPGELDEVQDAARAFGRLSPQLQALSGAVVAATGALAGAGGLVGAATALATRIGDVQLRRDLRALKQRFRSVGQSFVTAFEPLIRDQIIPAGEALAQKLEAVIPELVTFTENNLPDLSSAVTTLVEAVVNTAKVLGFVSRALGVLVSSVQLFSDLLKGPQVESATDVSSVVNEDAQAELTDIFQGFGFGGESIGFGSLTFNVPQTELRQSLEGRGGSNFGGGSRPSVTRGGGTVPVTEDIRKIQRQIAVARQKFQRLESFTKKDLLKALKKLRTKGLESLLMLEEKTGMSLDRTQEYEAALERVNGKLKRLKASNALEELAKETKQAADATKVPSAAEVAADNGVEGTSSIGSKIPDQISGIPNAQRKMNVLKQRLKEVSAFGRRATGILRQGFLRVGDAIGASLVKSIAQGKSAMQGLKSVFSSAIQSLISQLTALAVKLAVIAPLLGALGLGGPAAPSVVGQVGAGIFPGAASGGFVAEGGLARIHEGEHIIPKNASLPSDGGGSMSLRVRGQDLVAVTDDTRSTSRNSSRRIDQS